MIRSPGLAAANAPGPGPAPQLDCDRRRWIYRQPGTAPAACTTIAVPPGDWSSAQGFASSIQIGAPNLGRYCVITWSWATPPTAQEIDRLRASLNVGPGSKALVPDCTEVSALADLLGDDIWRDVQRDFELRVGSITSTSVVRPPPPRGRAGFVRVAVLDTARDNFGQPDLTPALDGEHPHGRAMALLIRRLACPEGPGGPGFCGAALSSFQALGRVANGDFIAGEGGVGTTFDVAGAIYRAISTAQSGDHLILNLSIGWAAPTSGVFVYTPSTPIDDLPAGVSAVRDALEHARCRGALTIAAAGNASGGPNPQSGPMYPAAWEIEEVTRLASRAACDRLYGGHDLSFDDRALLIYAVGGLNHSDDFLVNGRPNAHPRLGAAALRAVAPETSDFSPGAHSQILSGSSNAAAVTSAVSSMVWSLHPDLSSSQVIDVLYRGGVATTHSSDFGAQLPPQELRRVSACGALRELMRPWWCPGCVSSFACRPNGASTGYHASAAFDLGSVYRAGPVAPHDPPPEAVLMTSVAIPAVVPQPDLPGCPTCRAQVTVDAATGDVRAIVDVSLNSALKAGTALSEATLLLYPMYPGCALNPESVDLNAIIGPIAIDGMTNPNFKVDLQGLGCTAYKSGTISFKITPPGGYPTPYASVDELSIY